MDVAVSNCNCGESNSWLHDFSFLPSQGSVAAEEQQEESEEKVAATAVRRLRGGSGM